MKIHKEGRNIIVNQLVLLIIIGLISNFNSIFLNYTLPIFLFFILFSIYFFRVPKRDHSIIEGNIYSPCDGKVVVIEETEENEYFMDKRIQVSIFMSPLNVHNNIYPISGEVKYVKYHPGKFLLAWNPKSSQENERNTVVIKNKKVEILCRQIAGFLARRIVCYSKINTKTNAGEELGFIKFGSRVDLFLPIGTKINKKLNDKVIGGTSVIATLNN
ncbi:phosphatidylserine decarboxylase family protein [bacterium]|nr:phosphatidylserine decarboxylase family protein [bacterium]